MRSETMMFGRSVATDMVLPSAPGKSFPVWELAGFVDLMTSHAAVTPMTDIQVRRAGLQELNKSDNDHLNERRKHHGH
ncbi:hypothetical protein ACFONL_15735 [Camelimonas fluminis]|uniref:Uncharacterized protein n=1 Tax=Camelimonas fluminis TaxID=1576911 RepID=A0ABV7UJR4_9HYPH|nr:hypothetical protein [Camelimonas fluminis]